MVLTLLLASNWWKRSNAGHHRAREPSSGIHASLASRAPVHAFVRPPLLLLILGFSISFSLLSFPSLSFPLLLHHFLSFPPVPLSLLSSLTTSILPALPASSFSFSYLLPFPPLCYLGSPMNSLSSLFFCSPGYVLFVILAFKVVPLLIHLLYLLWSEIIFKWPESL
jgi:hypothetical protein